MAEMKQNFAGGKMNKDVDERLVPNGEYRHALNVQVSTSEGSDVGTIQNILGNEKINILNIHDDSVCVGSISDEKNDAFYWFIREPNSGVSPRDIILEYKNETVKLVFVDIKDTILQGNTQNPTSGNFSLPYGGINSLNVGDVITVQGPSQYLSDVDEYNIVSIDLNNNLINVGVDYTNSDYAQTQLGPGELTITVISSKPALKFPEKTITGVNIIDDYLFWTDNISEPKVINIPDSILGTNQTGNQQTQIPVATVNPSSQGNIPPPNNVIDVEEKHITVIKKSPKNVLTVETYTDEAFTYGTTLQNQTFLINPADQTQGNLTVGSILPISLLVDVNSPGYGDPLQLGSVILFNPSSSTSLPNDEHVVAGVITAALGGAISTATGLSNNYEIEITSILGNVSPIEQQYDWAVQITPKKRFKNKFPRYSYRYKYKDGQYSTFAPFTNIIFEPGAFKYDVKEAHNLGMENKISQVRLYGYNLNLPDGVVAVDLLYKESNSPVVYKIETLSKNQLAGNLGREVKIDQIVAALPENQLLRAFDNVPRQALAQSVTGSRIVYGNYLQNYNYDAELTYMNVSLTDRNLCDSMNSYSSAKKSLKSIRNYVFGVSFLDKYGRQTPVFTHKRSQVNIPIEKSKDSNQVSYTLNGPIPDWATHYKVFVKDVSNEYYNLAMDRIYDAKDGNIWISFPSSDRNKVDDETFLILKKGVETLSSVSEKNRYKILSIKNEAPEFIRRKIKQIGAVDEAGGGGVFPGTYFVDPNAYPIETYKKVTFSKTAWDVVGLPLTDTENLEIKFTKKTPTGSTLFSKVYEVANFNVDDDFVSGTNTISVYELVLDKPIDEEWLADPANPGQPDPTAGIVIFSVENRKGPEFDGRFFVKIARDILINDYITTQGANALSTYLVASTQLPFYYLADGNNPYNNDNTTGFPESNSVSDWDTNYSAAGINGSGWFIDAAYYAGYAAPGSETLYLNNRGLDPTGFNYITSSIDISNTNYPNMATTGFNKGIWTDPADGQVYIYLSFGNIRSDTQEVSSYASSALRLHTSANVGSTQVDLATGCEYWDSYGGACNDAAKEALYEGIYDWADNNDMIKHWKVGVGSMNSQHGDQDEVVARLALGQKFKFVGDGDDTIYTITGAPEIYYHLSHFNLDDMSDGYQDAWNHWLQGSSGSNTLSATEKHFDYLEQLGHSRNRRVTYRIPIDKDPTDPNVAAFNPISGTGAAGITTNGTIQFLEEEFLITDEQVVSENPAIWETEPKEDKDLEIYYEVDGTFPLEINSDTNYQFAPAGSMVSHPYIPSGTTIVGWEDNILELSNTVNDSVDNWNNQANGIVTFNRPDGSCVTATLGYFHEPDEAQGIYFTNKVIILRDVAYKNVNLSFFNCYSWGNGVESNRIRDDYNQVFIDKGAKASSTIEDKYEEERRKYGLIHSGLYNSTSGVNNLNQFIQAEKITKDINPIYGSIQKLHARDTDLITLCEDKVLKILANKDAVFNADNNPQLTATNAVLGQTVPFVGEFGISKNPESFASESYRVYFADKVRGSIMRLSLDGLTPISMHGMKDWFKDNLRLNDSIIGSYDDKKGEYNITLQETTENKPLTVSFKEDAKGWVSFKSFVPENGVSCANNYYTFRKGVPWKHHVEKFNNIGKEINRNNFYGIPYDSVITAIINDVPGSVKSFTTLNYEGSKSRVQANLQDNQHYNLSSKNGWYVDDIKTDLEKGSLNEFIKKEGKWFNYIKGKNIQVDGTTSNIIVDGLTGDSSFDQASFAIQGLGMLNTSPSPALNVGCTNPSAPNFDPNAIIDDGSCDVILMGCMETSATNFGPMNTVDDGSCLWAGCTCPSSLYPNGCTNETQFPAIAYTYGGNNIIDDGSCVGVVEGCTDPLAFNYDPLANTDNGSCIATVNGCMIASADNYNSAANTDDGTCTWAGCTQPLDTNYTGFPNAANTYVAFAGSQYGIQDDGSCVDGGCTDSSSASYDPTALWDDGSCTYCAFNTAMGSYNGIPVTTIVGNAATTTSSDGFVRVYTNMAAPHQPLSFLITDSNGSSNYGSYTTQSGGGYTEFPNLPADTYTLTVTGTPVACTYNETFTVGSSPQVLGCTDATACNYNAAADTDNGSCQWTTCAGCNDSTADNYSTQTNTAFTPPLSDPSNTPCYIPGTFNLGPCTINCGDGNSATDFGNFCCTYTSYGCTDPAAVNYNDPANYTGNYTFVDDGSCLYDIYGCTDPAANNYNSAATIDDGSCNYTVNGCTDSNACNYDSFATNDDGSCVYGFNNVTIGDPTTTDGNGVSVSTPVFYDNPSIPVTTAKHFMFPVPTTTPYPNVTYTTAQEYFPADIMNETDIGLAFSSLSPTQYGGGDIIHIKLWKPNTPGPGFTLQVHKQLPSPYPILDLQNFGNRVNSIPYGWGNMIDIPSLNDINNYEFEIYKPDGVTKEQYMLEIYSTINGVDYGKAWSSTASCGVHQNFEFTTLQACDHPSAISGCTDPMACNYDPNATCFIPCQYPFNQNYMYESDPNNPSVNICQPAPCLYTGTVYGTLQACQTANGGGN